jgi:hypothetical protein
MPMCQVTHVRRTNIPTAQHHAVRPYWNRPFHVGGDWDFTRLFPTLAYCDLSVADMPRS